MRCACISGFPLTAPHQLHYLLRTKWTHSLLTSYHFFASFFSIVVVVFAAALRGLVWSDDDDDGLIVFPSNK